MGSTTALTRTPSSKLEMTATGDDREPQILGYRFPLTIFESKKSSHFFTFSPGEKQKPKGLVCKSQQVLDEGPGLKAFLQKSILRP